MPVERNYLATPTHKLIYARLKEVARRHGPPIGYKVVFEIMGVKPSNYAGSTAGKLLDDINHYTELLDKPMISALVVSQERKIPGNGFFELAVRLGKLPVGASDGEKKAFWKEELEKVYAAEW